LALANRGPFSPRFRLLGSLRGNCGVAVERAATWPTHAPGQIGFRAIGRRTGRSVGGPGDRSADRAIGRRTGRGVRVVGPIVGQGVFGCLLSPGGRPRVPEGAREWNARVRAFPRLLGSRLLGSRLLGSRLLGSRLLGSRLLGSRLLGSRLRPRCLWCEFSHGPLLAREAVHASSLPLGTWDGHGGVLCRPASGRRGERMGRPASVASLR
jgi:hypothetical protein